MFRLLLRSQEQAAAISAIDEGFSLTGDVHTNVIAGLAMNDGETVAAWLPDAELEFGPLPMFPSTRLRDQTSRALIGPSANPKPSEQGSAAAITPFGSPELTVIGSDGKRWAAQYVGMDGVTGLSILKLAAKNLKHAALANENKVDVGQDVRLFGPEPVHPVRDVPSGSLLVRIGETNGRIWKVARTTEGGVARFKVRSPRINNAHVGGVALNSAGEALGIVDAVEGMEASILPAEMIRRAADRVLSRKSSVPKPWLGVQGEPLASLTSAQIENFGWEEMKASTLLSDHRGILLTSVATGSPAALAALKAGDVILKVNDEDIRSGDDFSWQLDQADPGKSIQVTVARPGAQEWETIWVKLGGALSPRFSFRRMAPFTSQNNSGLIKQGLETIALTPAVASRMGASAGLLVVYVEPATAAFEAGLRSGDVIQSIDGKPVLPITQPLVFTSTPGESHNFQIVRNRQKLTLTLVNPENNK
jgi:serine protease Do